MFYAYLHKCHSWRILTHLVTSQHMRKAKVLNKVLFNSVSSPFADAHLLQHIEGKDRF